MFNKTLVPPKDNKLNDLLNGLYAKSGVTADQKQIIEKKLDKVDLTTKEKIISTVTISEYFDKLWKQPELKDNDKASVIRKLEAIQRTIKAQIKTGEQNVAKTPANLDAINSAFKMTPFELTLLEEKIKDVKKTKKLEVEIPLFSNQKADLDVLHALNRPFKSVPHASRMEFLHYTSGLIDLEDDDITKKQKAEDFVKKIKGEKKAYTDKRRQKEKSLEEREREEFERYKQKAQEEEMMRLKEKKLKLENHIKELKTRSEVRLKESKKVEEDYKAQIGKKPLYREIETKFKKGFIIPELEERKKKLQEIRDFHKPIAREELLEHEQKMAKILEEKSTKKKEQSESAKWVYQKPVYESKHHKAFADETNKLRNMKENDQLDKLKRKERVMELLQEVKEKHAPKADPEKELEVLAQIEKLRKQRKGRDGRSRTVDDEEEGSADHRKLGNEYMSAVKEMVKKNRKASSSKEGRGDSTDKRDQKQSSTVKSEEVPKKRNYLAELRQENKLNGKRNTVDSIIKNKDLNNKEKTELLLSQVEKLEEKAKKREVRKKFKLSKGQFEDIDEDDEYDAAYINTIKAKLELLGS